MKGIANLFGNFFGVGFRLQTYLNILYLTLAFPLGVFYFVFLVTGLSTGLSTSFLLVGIFILALTLAIAWWLAEFERQQAIWLLRVPVGPMARPPEAPGFWSWLKAYLGNPVTWTGLFFLCLKFPLGIIAFCVTTTLLALSVGLLAAPLTFWWLPLNFFVWRIDTLPKALVVFTSGLIVLPLSLHLLNILAAGLGHLARLLLGGPAQPAQPASAPAPAGRATGTSCLLPTVAIALFACVACLFCSAIAAAPFLARNNENHPYEFSTATLAAFGSTSSPIPATATLTASPMTPTATPTVEPKATATPIATATLVPTLTPTATPAASDTPTSVPASPTPTETETPAATATETATLAPTSSPTPAGPDPMANAGNVLFEETFAPARYYWGTGDNPSSQAQIKDGGLSLTIKTVKRTVWTFSGAPTKADFYLSGVVTPATCAEGDHFGLVFRAQDESNLFLFGISCDGRYQLTQYVNGTAQPIVALTASGALQPQAANQLGVRAVGKQFDLYANGQFLATVEANTAIRGLFGVYASSAKTPGLSVVYGDLKAWEIKP